MCGNVYQSCSNNSNTTSYSAVEFSGLQLVDFSDLTALTVYLDINNNKKKGVFLVLRKSHLYNDSHSGPGTYHLYTKTIYERL